MNFAELLKEDQRLVILKALAQDLGYSHNESIIHTILERFGHKIGRDLVKTHLAWLREQGLVTLKEVCGYYVATITQRGLDVASGAAVAPGVKRPGPGR